MLFAGSTYYPSGGMNDFVSSYPTIEEAIKGYHAKYINHSYMWAHVYDKETGDTMHMNNVSGEWSQ
jgi:hypothetical protein